MPLTTVRAAHQFPFEVQLIMRVTAPNRCAAPARGQTLCQQHQTQAL